MPTPVPFENAPDINPSGAPSNDYQHIDVSADSFGGGVAKGLNALGQGGAQAAQTAFDAESAKATLSNELYANDASVPGMQEYTKIWSGFGKLKGAAAEAAMPDFNKQIEDAYQRTVKGAPNDQARQMLSTPMRTMANYYLRAGQGHADQEFGVWQQRSATARADELGNQAAIIASSDQPDWETFDTTLNGAADENRKLLEQQGYGLDEQASATRKFKGGFLSKIMQDKANEDPVAASNMLHKYGDEMDAGSRLTVENKLRPLLMQGSAREIGEAKLGRTLPDGTPQPMVANLDPSFISAMKRTEGFAPQAKWDFKQHSNGYGTKALAPGEKIDRPEAERRFNSEVTKAANFVDKVNPNLDPGTRAALTSLTFNAGDDWASGGLGNAIRAGDLQTARRLFLQYNRAGGQVNDGLVDRRQREAKWFGSEPAQVAGMAERGNIDLNARPVVKNANGKISTVRSASFNLDGKEVLLPTVTDDGRILDERTPEGKKEILETYAKTGKHLGKFDTPEQATAYAQQLHEDQEKLYPEGEPDATVTARRYQEASWFGRATPPTTTALPDKGRVIAEVMDEYANRPALQAATISYIEKQYALNEQMTAADRAQFKQRVKDSGNEALLYGQVKDPISEDEFIQRYGFEEGLKAHDDYTQDLQLGADIQASAAMSPQEQQEMLMRQAPQPGQENFEDAAKRFDSAGKAVEAVNKEKEKDPAAFAISRLPVVRQAYEVFANAASDQNLSDLDRATAAARFADATTEEQRRIGIADGDIRILPKAYADNLTAMINNQVNSGGPSQVAGIIEAQAKLWGEHWPQVYRQVAKEAGPMFRVIGSGIKPDAANILADVAAVKTEDILKNQTEDTTRNIKNGVLEAFKPFASTMLGQSGAVNVFNDFREQGEKLTSVYVMRGMAPDDAAEAAYEKLIGFKYDFADTYRIPKDINYKSDDIQKGAVDALDRIGEMNIHLRDTLVSGVSDQHRHEQTVEALQRDGIWVTAPDESGLALIYNGEAVRTKDEKPLIVPWSDLAVYASTSDIRIRPPL